MQEQEMFHPPASLTSDDLVLIIHSGRWTFVSILNNCGFILIPPSNYPDLNHIGSATVERFLR